MSARLAVRAGAGRLASRASGPRKGKRSRRARKIRPIRTGRRKLHGTATPRPGRPERNGSNRVDVLPDAYDEGVYDGGEALLEARLPADRVYPDLTLDDVLAAGIAALKPSGIPLLGPAAVYDELERALDEGIPYSLVRLGDGELLTMAQGTVLSATEVSRQGPFLAYAGVNVPDIKARDVLTAAVQAASVIGIPLSRKPTFQPLLFKVWRALGIDWERIRLTTSTINYALEEGDYWPKLMAGRRVLVVGNAAAPLARVLGNRGVRIAAAVGPVRGISDWERVAEEASGHPFDLALVSAGIAAVPICVRLVERTGKAAVDFGHLADRMAGLEYQPKIRR
ncbi:GT-D fold domain-containing glycosyltransferase [Cohnella massiliensis]|uniref:GT-D fold domain-containing protein n=2 Tax=Cohnella TaxID=329857 RepID=UPI0009B9A68E|nr:GT-D fold domain-containing glycosyltransferase [Cohnella massiliensis]